MTLQLQVIEFSLVGRLAHFRQPDTIITQASYPFPARPTLLGLLASILGIDYSSNDWASFLEQGHWIGLSLLAPIRTVCAQISLLGDFILSSGKSFNRPTTVELVVNPVYHGFYAGPALSSLKEMLKAEKSVFHTYLGAAYCLTFPKWIGEWDAEIVELRGNDVYDLSSIVPQDVVDRILLDGGGHYATARGMPYKHYGDRTFAGARTLVYECEGKPLRVRFRQPKDFPFNLCRLPDGRLIGLW